MKQVVILNSHPIQYFSPLYKQMTDSGLQLSVCYCSDESIKGKFDRGFGKEVKWNIPLVDGYHAVFLKNYSWKPSIHNGFFGLFNPGIISFLQKQQKSIVVIHGWAYCTHILAIIFAKLFGHTVCLRSETPLNQEKMKPRITTFLKHIYLRALFLFVDRFLYIGKQNKLFYESLGIKESKLVFTPYAVDNKRFRIIYETTSIQQAREILKLPENKKIILYSGKFISKKRPLDLIKAFHQSLEDNAILVMTGEGALREEMETYIYKNDLGKQIILTGFINQAEIPLYYRAADIFVMCSGLGETWGLSVNEAMNFGLPVIVSDTCGCAYDLIRDNINGAVFETGNISQLVNLLHEFLHLTPERKKSAFNNSLSIIDEYSYDHIISSIQSF